MDFSPTLIGCRTASERSRLPDVHGRMPRACHFSAARQPSREEDGEDGPGDGSRLEHTLQILDLLNRAHPLARKVHTLAATLQLRSLLHYGKFAARTLVRIMAHGVYSSRAVGWNPGDNVCSYGLAGDNLGHDTSSTHAGWGHQLYCDVDDGYAYGVLERNPICRRIKFTTAAKTGSCPPVGNPRKGVTRYLTWCEVPIKW